MLDRPSLQEVRSRIQADADTRLGGLDPRLRRSLLRLVVFVLAGASHELHGFAAGEIRRRMLPDAAGDGLRRLAAAWGISPAQADFAEGSVTFTGTGGTAIDNGTLLQVDDGGGETVEYETTAAGTVGAAVAVRATTAGAAANQDAGALLELVSPIAGVDPTAAVGAGGLVGGQDAEGDAELLAQLEERLQEPPQGGNLNDWERWVREAGVGATRIWVTPPPAGSGVVSIRFVVDDQDPITATAQQVQDVVDYLTGEDVQPLGAVPSVGTPTLVPRDLTIASLEPDTPEVRAAIEAEYAARVLEDATPGGTLRIARIREAISRALGEENHELTSPVADLPHAAGEIPVPGTVSFV